MSLRAKKNAILGAFLFLVLICSMGQFAASPLAPFLMEKLGLSKTQIGFLTSAVFWGTFAFGLISGAAADKFGEKRMILVGTGIIAVSLLFFSLAHDFHVFLICSFFIGAGYSTIMALTNRGLSVIYPREERAFALGMKQGGMPVGTALGAFLIPVLATYFTWQASLRMLALAILVFGVMCFLLYIWLSGPLLKEQAASSDPINTGESGGEKVTESSYLQLIFNFRIMTLLMLGTGFIIIQTVFITFTIPYLQEALAISVVAAGQFTAVLQLSGAVSRPACGIIGDRAFGGQREYTLFTLALLISVFTLALSFINESFPWWLVVLMVIPAGFTSMGWYGIYFAQLSEAAGPGHSGKGIGLGITSNCLGISIGNPLFGYIADVTGTYTTGYQVFAGIIFVLSLVFIGVFKWKEKQRLQESW